MSNEQSDSSKKSKQSKNGITQKVKGFTSKQRVKLTSVSSKAKNQLSAFYSDKIIHQEVYVDGKEPKSYSFQRKFYGLYGIFILYSLILISAINFPKSDLINALMFGNPFAFSNAIVAFFLALSILLSIDKVRVFIFEEKTVIKQIIVYFGLLSIFYLLFLYLSFSANLNIMTYLLTLAMIWLLLLSSRFYISSRKFSTKIEARFIKKYSIPRYLVAIIIPFIILGVLVIISLFFRFFLVWLSLEFFGNADPTSAVKVYNLQMRVIMPLIYFSLIMTLVFIIFEFVLTRRRAETKRAGTFDNFTFSLIVLFIFFFQIFQISIFMLLQEDTVIALKATVGATGSAASYIFIFEFIISMYFLYRIVRKTGKTLGWRILIFKKDGLILLCLACVLAQTLSRFALASQVQNQVISDVGVVLMADKYIISVLMIFFLGSTILVYYLKPHETSMFMRLQKETVSEEEKSMERVYKIVRSEFIRRGEAYPVEIIERELIKATQLSKGNVYTLLEQLANKDMDIVISEEKQDLGKPIKMINFVSVTERFEKKGVAKQKARRYLSERLLETALEKDRKTSRLTSKAETGEATNSFISSLSTDYSKKQKDADIRKEKMKKTEISFSSVTEDLKNQILQIIKKEYIYRMENQEKTPDFYIPISEISNEIELATKINPGELYPILEDLNKNDIEISLENNPDEPEDKKIRILPFADDNMNYSLANFRPDEYSKFKIIVTKSFLKNLKAKKEKRVLFQLKKEIPSETESQKSWIELLDNLHKYYPLYSEQLEKIPDTPKVRNLLDDIIKDFEKKQILVE
jgi:DNA-binding PadR family transcriptional regulator